MIAVLAAAALLQAASPPAQAQSAPAADPHAGHAMPADAGTSADPHAGHVMPPAAAARPDPKARRIGRAPPPPPPTDHYAERVYDPADMAAARALLRKEHGGGTYALVSLPIAEYRARRGEDGYRWNGEAWYGSDYHRVVLRSEGEGAFGRTPEEAEVQLLYSTPIDAYWDVQAGIRQDVGEGPSRTYVTLAVEGLAPYWFDVEGAVFVSHRGELLARVEASYDARITQRLILQPRVEVEAALQNIPERGVGSGLSDGKLDLRLRYEIVQEFAPYIGVTYERTFGDTARYRELRGEGRGATFFSIGVASFF